jgi:hypothetical protein
MAVAPQVWQLAGEHHATDLVNKTAELMGAAS